MDNQFELPKEGVRIYNPDSGWQTGPEPLIPSTSQASRVQASDSPVGQDALVERDSARTAPTDDLADELDEPAELEEAKQEADGLLANQRDTQSTPAPAAKQEPAPLVTPPPTTGPAPSLRARRPLGDRVYTARAETVKPYARPMAAPLSHVGQDDAGPGTATLVPQTQAAALARVGDSLESLFTAIQRSTVDQVVEGNAPSWRDVANISRHLEDRLNTRQHLLKELHSVDQEIRETRQDLLLTLNALSEYEQQNLQAASMRASISAVAAKVIAKRFAESGED